jgi:hypothetical protein
MFGDSLKCTYFFIKNEYVENVRSIKGENEIQACRSMPLIPEFRRLKEGKL